MPAIGMGMLWGGYTLMFFGWCKLKGYDITLADVVIPKHFKGTWPPRLVDDNARGRLGLIPGRGGKLASGDPSGGTSSGGSSGGSSSGSSGGSMFV